MAPSRFLSRKGEAATAALVKGRTVRTVAGTVGTARSRNLIIGRSSGSQGGAARRSRIHRDCSRSVLVSSLATRRAAPCPDSSKIRQRRSREKDRAARKAGAAAGPGLFAAFCSQSMMARQDQGTARRGQMQSAATRGATDRSGQETSGNERDTSDTLVTSSRHRGYVGGLCPGGDRAVLDRPRRG